MRNQIHQIDKEANRFAMELLMPSQMVIEKHKTLDLPRVDVCFELAKIFAVETCIMAKKLQELDLPF